MVSHLKSREFREEFFSLIRNDEIYIKLLSLHLYLLSDRLKHIYFPLSLRKLNEYMNLKKSTLILNSRKFPKRFLYYGYEHFHAHLPEELFFDDFTTFFKKANAQTYRDFSRAFESIES